ADSKATSNRVKLTLTFSPTQSLEMIECALLIRSSHGTRGQSNVDQEKLDHHTSSFDSLYAIVKGLAGEQKLVIDSMSRQIDFGVCRIGQTYTKTMVLSNPGNIRVDYHLGPDLDQDEMWKNYVPPAGQQSNTLASASSSTLPGLD